MASVGDDGSVAQPHPDRDDGASGGSFDPGVETGYLRRAPRDRELSPELGAVPFDPGPGRFDDRRARRAAKRKQRQQLRASKATSIGSRSSLATAVEAEDAAELDVARPDHETSPSVVDPAAGAPPQMHPIDALLQESAAPQWNDVIPLEHRETLAERLERERIEREREERERRARVAEERAEHEQARR